MSSPNDFQELSTNLMDQFRQTAPPSTPDGRDQWIMILAWVAAGFSAAAAIAVLVMSQWHYG